MSEWSLYRDTQLGERGDSAICLADVLAANDLFHNADSGARVFPDQAQEPFARGRYRASTIRPFVRYIDCDFETVAPLRVRGPYGPGICLGLLMKGSWSSAADRRPLEFVQVGLPVALMIGEPIEFTTNQRAGRHCRMAAIYVDAEFFQSADQSVPSSQRLTHLLTPGFDCLELASGILSSLLLRLYDNPYLGPMADLYAEGLTLSTIVELAAHIRGSGESIVPLRSHRDKIHEARRLLFRSPTSVPSIAQLARDVGLAETTLRRLFKSTFGTTIFEYVRNERLEAARIMLREGRFQVAEVAYRVGYSDPANFTTAFKHRFGYPPRQEAGRS